MLSSEPIDYTRPPSSGKCPTTGDRNQDWIEFQDRCYMFVDDQHVTMAEARQACVFMGADLASILDNTTNEFIHTKIQVPDFPYYWCIGLIRSPSTLFRSLTDVKCEELI